MPASWRMAYAASAIGSPGGWTSMSALAEREPCIHRSLANRHQPETARKIGIASSRPSAAAGSARPPTGRSTPGTMPLDSASTRSAYGRYERKYPSAKWNTRPSISFG